MESLLDHDRLPVIQTIRIFSHGVMILQEASPLVWDLPLVFGPFSEMLLKGHASSSCARNRPALHIGCILVTANTSCGSAQMMRCVLLYQSWQHVQRIDC